MLLQDLSNCCELVHIAQVRDTRREDRLLRLAISCRAPSPCGLLCIRCAAYPLLMGRETYDQYVRRMAVTRALWTVMVAVRGAEPSAGRPLRPETRPETGLDPLVSLAGQVRHKGSRQEP
jgi:hypothetical protein